MIFSLIVYLSFILIIVLANVISRIIFENKKLYGEKHLNHLIIFNAAFSCFVLWILFSLKSIHTGSDTKAYFDAYNSVANDTLFLSESLKNPVHYEVGFLFFMSLIAHTHVPYFVFQCLVYLIICLCLFFSSIKLTKNPTFSILIFFTFTFYNFFISGLRQSLAISLCLFAITYFLVNKKSVSSYFIFFLFVAIASSMHNSAILVTPIIFLKNFRITQKKIVLLSLFTVLFYIFGYQIYYIFMGIVATTNLVYVEAYVAYSGGAGKTPMLMLALTIFSFIVLYPNVVKQKINNHSDNKIIRFFEIKEPNNDVADFSSLLILLMFFGCWLEFLNRFSSGVGRASMYFTIVIIFLVPNALEHFKNNKTKYSLQGIFTLGFVAFLFYYSILTNLMDFRYELYF